MEFDKPKVTIDLDEYNHLKKTILDLEDSEPADHIKMLNETLRILASGISMERWNEIIYILKDNGISVSAMRGIYDDFSGIKFARIKK